MGAIIKFSQQSRGIQCVFHARTALCVKLCHWPCSSLAGKAVEVQVWCGLSCLHCGEVRALPPQGMFTAHHLSASKQDPGAGVAGDLVLFVTLIMSDLSDLWEVTSPTCFL